METAANDINNVKLANSVFKKFQKYKLTTDDRKEIFLDAIWYSLANWKPEKSAFQTYLCNNVWYKTCTFIRKKYKHIDKSQTNFSFRGLISHAETFSNDFDNMVAVLHDNYKIPLIQKFVYGMSATEIGKENGYNKSYALLMIKKGLERIKKSV